MTNPGTTRVLIADRQDIFRSGLRSILSSMETVSVAGETFDEVETRRFLEVVVVDVVLLDLHMGGRSGGDLLQGLKAQHPDLGLLVLVPDGAESWIRRAVELHVDGVLVRSASSFQLETAVREVGAGHRFIQPEVLRKVLSERNQAPLRANHGLTTRRGRILRSVSEGMSNKQIAKELGVSETTVKSELRVVYGELGVSNRAEASAVALREGLLD